MSTKMGNCQWIRYATYMDCKRRTKKKIDFPCDEKGHNTADEKLVKFLLSNSSIIEHEGERAFSNVCDAIDVMCHQLCPGKWCNRTHCAKWDSGSAYHCTKSRPAVCEKYKKYVAGIEERKSWRYVVTSKYSDEVLECRNGSDYVAWNEKRMRCYGNCAGCQALSNKQIKPNRQK